MGWRQKYMGRFCITEQKMNFFNKDLFSKCDQICKWKTSILFNIYHHIKNVKCVKSVQIRSYFWSVFSCIRTRNDSVLDTFHAVISVVQLGHFQIYSIVDVWWVLNTPPYIKHALQADLGLLQHPRWSSLW